MYPTLYCWFRFMQLRIAISLIRFILFVLVIQLLSPVLVQAVQGDSNSSTMYFNLNSKTEKNPSLLVLLNENNEEKGEEENKENLRALELVDFSFVKRAISFFHSIQFYDPPSSALFPQPLFDLHCILII